MSYHKCPFCSSELAWQSDFNIDETHPELETEEGYSSFWNCNSCDCLLEFLYVDDAIRPNAIIPYYDEEE